MFFESCVSDAQCPLFLMCFASPSLVAKTLPQAQLRRIPHLASCRMRCDSTPKVLRHFLHSCDLGACRVPQCSFRGHTHSDDVHMQEQTGERMSVHGNVSNEEAMGALAHSQELLVWIKAKACRTEILCLLSGNNLCNTPQHTLSCARRVYGFMCRGHERTGQKKRDAVGAASTTPPCVLRCMLSAPEKGDQRNGVMIRLMSSFVCTPHQSTWTNVRKQQPRVIKNGWISYPCWAFVCRTWRRSRCPQWRAPPQSVARRVTSAGFTQFVNSL